MKYLGDIEDNKNFREVNKGLSAVINQIIEYVSTQFHINSDNYVATKIIKILNLHHQNLKQKNIITRGDSILKDDVSSTLTISSREKENIDTSHSEIKAQNAYKSVEKSNLQVLPVINRKSSIEK